MKFSESITISTTAERLFDFTQDYDQRLSWDTFLQKAELVNGAVAADLGVKAYCEAHNGMGMVTEYVSFRRPKVTAIKMTKGPYMFKSFLGSWNFREFNPGFTEVQFLYSFELRFPFNLASWFIQRKLRKEAIRRLLDLKLALEKEV